MIITVITTASVFKIFIIFSTDIVYSIVIVLTTVSVLTTVIVFKTVTVFKNFTVVDFAGYTGAVALVVRLLNASHHDGCGHDEALHPVLQPVVLCGSADAYLHVSFSPPRGILVQHGVEAH